MGTRPGAGGRDNAGHAESDITDGSHCDGRDELFYYPTPQLYYIIINKHLGYCLHSVRLGKTRPIL